ncbi:MAG TPA: hypothetical protein GX505_14150 [Clostridiales bacterium]|nr:hypothetical protein [Clostridiales bacterium]
MGRKLHYGIASILIVSLLAVMLSGCAGSSNPNPTKAPQATEQPSGNNEGKETEGPKEKITLTQLAVSNPAIDALIGGDFNKRPWNIEMEKRTGVHIEYLMTTNEDYDTQMSLLITSGDIPDLFSLPSNYPGGL